ncbi:tetratricopeptide repeat protein [Neomegalonema perideroedes]|uniref:tetratricopeptide repeat protein n=1 Tax=Neomegalonema perideroedes TaxID=217219 RepID=UPI00035EE9DD|nr:tetratricopeptide repeat protein [Neomegalonema perideroedes]
MVLFLAAGFSAQAQDLELEGVEPFAIPEMEGAAAEAPPPAAEDAAPQTRAERLDALFAQLLDPAMTEAAATRVQAQIGRLWSESGSDTLDLLLLRGKRAVRAGELDKAKAHFSRLIAFAPEFPEGWSSRAAAAYADGDFGRALADVGRAVELEPRHFAAWSGLGAILEKMDRPQEALTAFRKALEINPFSQTARDGVKRLEREVDGRDA